MGLLLGTNLNDILLSISELNALVAGFLSEQDPDISEIPGKQSVDIISKPVRKLTTFKTKATTPDLY